MGLSKRVLALGHLRPLERNKTEAEYERYLELQKRSGGILAYSFGMMNLRLADNTFYKVDFTVVAKDGVLEIHEVKGFWTDDALVKIKVAASLHPFRFCSIKKIPRRRGGGWERRDF